MQSFRRVASYAHDETIPRASAHLLFCSFRVTLLIKQMAGFEGWALLEAD